jgi:lysophospholipase L1-like esterase
LNAVVFYDENGNGSLDAGENVRLPGVTVTAGGQTAVSAQGGGQVVVSGLPSGTITASIQAGTLPPYYLAGGPVSVALPQAPGARVALPARLPIGSNRPNRYLGFGDSITVGEGSTTGDGYRALVTSELRAYWGAAEVIADGASGSRTANGAERMGAPLVINRPAYTLILYGTNDWNNLACRDQFPCDTVDNIRSMIRQCREFRSLPIVGTIPPVNPAFVDRDAEARNQWVASMNALIRPMVSQEGAVLADVHAAFLREPNLTALFADRLHPNDRGYQVLGREWVRAITTPAPTTAPTDLLFRSPGT